MAEFKTLKYFLTKLPTTPAHIYREVYTDLFALFNSFRKLLSDLDEALLDYLTDAPEDGKTYGRKDGEWTEVTGGSGIVETVVAGSGISVDDTDPANPIVSSTVNPFVEAPEDGQLYGRKDANWEVVTTPTVEWGDIAGTLSDQTDLATALSGKEPSITAGTPTQYWRGDKTWQTLPSAGIGEAPNDGQAYVRKSLGWSVASGGGSTYYENLIDRPPTNPSSWNAEFSGSSLAAGWTLVNPTNGGATASVTVHDGSVWITDSATVPGQARLLTKSAPAGNFDVIAKIIQHAGATYSSVGLGIYNSPTKYFYGARAVVRTDGQSLPTVGVLAFTDPNGLWFPSEINWGVFPHRLYFRVRRVSGTLSFYVSAAGVYWYLLATIPAPTFNTIALYYSDYSSTGGTASTLECQWIRNY